MGNREMLDGERDCKKMSGKELKKDAIKEESERVTETERERELCVDGWACRP